MPVRKIGNGSSMNYKNGGGNKQGYPVKIFGKNALAFFKEGTLDGFTFQEEIDAAFERPDIPNYEPTL